MPSRIRRTGQDSANRRGGEGDGTLLSYFFGSVVFRQANGTLSLPTTEDFRRRFVVIGGHVFTDGSGGTETKDLRFRRCGYGVACVLANGGTLHTLGGRARTLHGKTQSVAMAELPAAVVALQLYARATQQVIIRTDRMFVINWFARGRRRKRLSHADLCEDFLERSRCHRSAGLGTQSLEKPRHGSRNCCWTGLISPLEAYGNEVADKLPARGALRNALSLQFVAAFRHTDSGAKLVQTRLIEVNLLHVQNKPKIVRAVAKAPVRRAKFDPRTETIFSRTQVGKGRHTFKCRRCLIRGDNS